MKNRVALCSLLMVMLLIPSLVHSIPDFSVKLECFTTPGTSIGLAPRTVIGESPLGILYTRDFSGLFYQAYEQAPKSFDYGYKSVFLDWALIPQNHPNPINAGVRTMDAAINGKTVYQDGLYYCFIGYEKKPNLAAIGMTTLGVISPEPAVLYSFLSDHPPHISALASGIQAKRIIGVPLKFSTTRAPWVRID